MQNPQAIDSRKAVVILAGMPPGTPSSRLKIMVIYASSPYSISATSYIKYSKLIG